MTVQTYVFITAGYAAALCLLVAALVAAQLAGYWRWQDVVAGKRWATVLAQIITLATPLVVSAAILFSI